MRGGKRALSSSALLIVVLGGCGSRTGLDGLPPIPECDVDADCATDDRCKAFTCVEQQCELVFEQQCVSDDACSTSACDSTTGACVNTRLTRDTDRDGFFAPLPGTRPGAAGSCGDDCDDTRSGAQPGGIEVCDGVDNDCDGVVDNGSVFLSADVLPGIPVATPLASSGHAQSGGRAIAYGAEQFITSYWAGDAGETHGYLSGRSSTGDITFKETSVTTSNAPSFGASVVWSGAAFGAAWSDTRFNNYEVIFAPFTGAGEKLSSDVRVTAAPDMSIESTLLFDQGRFTVVFTDLREFEATRLSRVYGQLISEAGTLVGAEVMLSSPAASAGGPSFAFTTTRLGVVYTALVNNQVVIEFRTFDKDLTAGTTALTLAGSEGRSAQVTALGENFLVLWDTHQGILPGPSIQAALVSGDGVLLQGPQTVTSGASFARTPSAVSLGDRVLMAWSDDFDGNYEIYAQVLGLDLTEIEPRRRLTNDAAQSIGPMMSLSDKGAIGLLWDDWRIAPQQQAFFMQFGCAAP